MSQSEKKAQPLEWNEYQKLLSRMDEKLFNWRKEEEPSIRTIQKIDRWTRYQTLFVAGTYFGLRAKEFLSLNWEKVVGKSEGDVLNVNQFKTKKSRLVYFNATAIRYFDRNYSDIDPLNPHELILPKISDPFTAVSTRQFNLELVRIFDDCKIKCLSPSSHTFRKTFATRLWEDSNQGQDVLIQIQEALGHEDFKDTMAYLGITEDRIRNNFLRL